MPFTHPLARSAKVWTASACDGADEKILVIITTLPLDPAHKRYKRSLIERLSEAAREHLAATSEASSFLLMNRPHEWTSPSPRRVPSFAHQVNEPVMRV